MVDYGNTVTDPITLDTVTITAAVPEVESAEIRFNGKRYGYWEQVEISDSVDDLCASVRLSIALNRAAGETLRDAGIDANTVIEVLAEDEPVTTVRLDNLRRAVSANEHTINLQARSLGRELVDCQDSVTLSGLTLAQIIQRLCDRYQVPVKIEAETVVVPDFSMQAEQPSNALINIVRAANLLLYPTADGGLVLTSPNSAPPVATLEYGVSILRYEVIDEYKLRFSDYVIKGYDYEGGKSTAGRTRDEGIGFYRPLEIVADRAGTGLGGSERRAEFERNRRLARAHRIELSVPGWTYFDAEDNVALWSINTQVRVVISEEDIDDVLLIGERTFSLDDRGGKVTRLQVMRRDAFLGGSAKGKGKGKKGQPALTDDLDEWMKRK